MRITERELNRATLARQLLLERSQLSLADAVRRVVALQAAAQLVVVHSVSSRTPAILGSHKVSPPGPQRRQRARTCKPQCTVAARRPTALLKYPSAVP
jgi:hypothetical protein